MTLPPPFQLKNGSFEDLFNPAWLEQQDLQFLDRLHQYQSDLHAQLLAYRHQAFLFSPEAISELLIACAPVLEEYLAELFNIETALLKSAQHTLSHQPIFAFKKWYVQRQARRQLKSLEGIPSFTELHIWLLKAVKNNFKELSVATLGQSYLKEPEIYVQEIEQLTAWCVRALTDPEAQPYIKDWVSFKLPQKKDYEQLVPLYPVMNDPIGRLQGDTATFRSREGFKLTDPRFSQKEVLNEIDYCIYCHDKAGDFCSKGFPNKKGVPEAGLKKNPLGETLTGCPLEEKISEMHVLKKEGHTIGALAMVMIDNPMCPATGHRICNDCMKSCIYQKQDPVNIPQTETGILTDVLSLPWGVEIYDLLTRWNPLRQTQWVIKPYNGLKVLITGMGPAGFSLAHHLLMEGCAVVGTDGLKIEPLPEKLLKEPIYQYDQLKEALDERVMAGFGGVAEYGITVRWDKNFLKLIYISLMRRPYFQVFGGIRFGGTVTVEDAWNLGFDHLAVAVGAGLPKALPIPNSMAPGMRQANDFLMALQLTGTAKKNSLANLQLRLPSVVIGGGLTGIDTATEVQAYYIVQIEKTRERYQILAHQLGEARLRQQFDPHSLEILDEHLHHAREIQAERELAEQQNRKPDFIPLLQRWGGVTIAYRRLLRESPAYLRNHEEVLKAFEEGIYYAEGLAPKSVQLDSHGHVKALISESRMYDEHGEWVLSDEQHILPARSIFVATGAAPNVAYEFEHQGTFEKEKGAYKTYDADGILKPIPEEHPVKLHDFGAFTSYRSSSDKRVSFLGDTHPVFHGSVVNAIASAKRIYPEILKILQNVSVKKERYLDFAEHIQEQFTAHITNVIRRSPSVVEIQIKAPLAVKNYKPGHFYRVQNFETHAKTVEGTLLQTEAMALLGAKADKAAGVISLMVIEEGASSRLFATLQPGDPVSLMGPTGVRTKIPEQETVLIIGGRVSAAQLLCVGPSLRAAGNKVLYVGSFTTAEEVFCQAELEAAADQIIWITRQGPLIAANRPQDHSVQGELIDVLNAYAKGELDIDGPEIPFQKVNRVLLIGKVGLLRVMQKARSEVLKSYFSDDTQWVASVYGPMQCMLKGVCAQCFNWQIDPKTGQRTKAVFACSWHHQPLEWIDIANLEERLSQNKMQEILSNVWLDHVFSKSGVSR